MRPCLLLALVLLGTGSARCAPASPAVTPGVPLHNARCPLATTTLTLTTPGPRGATTHRYAVVNQCRSFQDAQNICACYYHGQLASVPNAITNTHLQCQARLSTHNGLVWIGAITDQFWRCHWTDGTPWGFSNWEWGYPLCGPSSCTALCTNTGRWRSLPCGVKLPFICKC